MAAHGEQMALHQAGLARHDHADGDIGLAHAEIELVVRQHEADVDLGIEGDELVHLGGEPGRAEADRRGDLEPAGRLVLVGAQQRLGGVDLGRHVTRRAVEQLALLREDQATRMAVEQHDAELLFERADLARDRRLAELQCSPACVKLPASATAWKIRSLSQSISIASLAFASARLLFGGLREPCLLCRQPFLGLERRHAAGAGGRHGLPENLVLHVTGRVDAFDIGRGRIGLGDQIALAVHRELALEQLGVGRVADGDEHAVGGKLALRARLHVAHAHALDQRRRRRLAGDFLDRVIPQHRDLGVLEQAVLQDLLGAEAVAAMDRASPSRRGA